VTDLTEHTTTRLVAAGLDPAYVLDVVTRALEEDLAGGLDVTSVATVPFDQESRADLVARGDGDLCGFARERRGRNHFDRRRARANVACPGS
jgi:nicotinate-nucleotide pyrophosphorylase (carboxylating)